MRYPFYSALTLVALTLAAHAQTPTTTLPHPPDHSTILPLTTNVTYTHLQTSPNGTTSTQTEQGLQANDSQGRQLTSNTVTSTNLTTSAVDDPVTGIRYAWNSSTKLAKAMHYAEPAVGRRSCWRLPAEEINPPRAEPQLGIIGTTCLPAESSLPQPAYCKSHHLPTSSATDLPEIAVAPTSCTSLLQQQPFEDLGTKVFNGFLAQGCRTTSGYQTTDIWAITLSSATLGAIVQLHGVVDDHEPNQPDRKTTQDLTLLQVREPPASTFQPPPDYALKPVDLQEVPCPQTQQP